MKPHTGNIVIITDNLGKKVLLLHKLPFGENDAERQRLGKRTRVGIGKWGLPGGGNEKTDKSDIHAAQRETRQETGLEFLLIAFRKIGVLEGFRQKETKEHMWIAGIYMTVASADMLSQVRINPEEHDKFGWFETNKIPWDEMIESDREWLPRLLDGKTKGLAVQVTFKVDTEDVLFCNVQDAAFSR